MGGFRFNEANMSNESVDPDLTEPVRGRRFRFSLRGLFAAVFVCGVVFFVLFRVLLPAVHATRESGRRSSCTSHLKIIGMAMNNYHDAFGCFPPAYVPGPDGKPAHSWRVLLLPYLGFKGVYTLYDFNEPWDGPNNSRLAGMMPDGLGSPIYSCPSDRTHWRNGETNYVMITGPGTMFENGKSLKKREIRDGTENTIIVVEVAKSGIQWSEPRDLEFDKMSCRINDPSQPSISSHHPSGATVLFADGSAHFLSNDTDPAVVRALITPGTGDDPGPFVP
jgi:prepilin-type processing-associated H-X9-DG protein